MHFLSALAQHEMEWYSQYMKPELIYIIKFWFLKPRQCCLYRGIISQHMRDYGVFCN